MPTNAINCLSLRSGTGDPFVRNRAVRRVPMGKCVLMARRCLPADFSGVESFAS